MQSWFQEGQSDCKNEYCHLHNYKGLIFNKIKYIYIIKSMLQSSGPRMDPCGTPFMIFRKVLYSDTLLPFASYLRGNFAAGNMLSQKGHRLPDYQ